MERQPPTLVYEDDVHEVWLEISDYGAPFIHFELRVPFTHNVLKRMIYNWNYVIIQAFIQQGFKKLYACTNERKVAMFASHFGFEMTDKQILGSDNQIRGVLEWVKL